MDLFNSNCYSIIKDKKLRKKIMKLDAIACKRSRAVENRIKVAKSAIENNDMKTFCEVMHVDTKLFLKELEKLPEDEQKVILEDARQSAKKQQERLVKIQHEDYLKRHNIYEFLDIKCPICGNSFTSYQKERFEPTFLKIECNCRKCNKSFYGFEHSDRIELWEERNFAIFSEPKYVIKESL